MSLNFFASIIMLQMIRQDKNQTDYMNNCSLTNGQTQKIKSSIVRLIMFQNLSCFSYNFQMLASNSKICESNIKNRVDKVIKELSLIQSNSCMQYFIILTEILLFTILLLNSFQSSLRSVAKLSQIVVGGNKNSEVIFWIYIGIGIIAICSQAIKHRLRIEKKAIKNIITFCYLFLQSSAVLYHANAAAVLSFLTKIISSSIHIGVIIAYICFFPVSFLLLYIQQQLHLLGFASIFVVFLQKRIQSNLWQIVFFGIVLLSFWSVRTISQKFGCLALLLTQVWTFCHRNITDSNSVELLYLAFDIIGALFFSIYFQSILQAEKPGEILLKLARKFKEQKKGEKQELELKISQKIEILHIIEQLGEEQDLQAEREAVLNNKVRPQNVFSILAAVNRGQKDKWLQAQVQVLRNESALRIFRLLGEIEPESIHETVRLQQLKQRAEANNSVTSSKQIDVRVVQQTNAEIESFYQQIYWSAEALVEFWKDVSGSNIKTAEVSGKFKTVMDHQDEAKRCLERAKKTHACLREKELLGQWENITNHYLEESEDSNLNSLHRKSEVFDCDFVVLSNNEIIKISERLLVELNLLRQGKYSLEQSQLFPQRLINIIFHNLSLYGQSFNLPLVVDNRLIVKKATVHMLPSYNSDAKYLVTLTPSEVRDAFLYDVSANEILCYSADFFRYLQATILPSAVIHIPSEIFTINLRDEAVELWQKGSSVNCQLKKDCCKLIIGCLTSEIQKLKFNLNLLNIFEDINNRFYLIQIRGNSFNTLGFSNFLKPKQKGPLFSQRQISHDYKNQKFFCPIKNPFRQNILEKIQNHKKIKSHSVPFWISLFFSAILVLAIIFLTLIIVTTSDRHNFYAQSLNQGFNLNQEYLNLISLFYESHIRYYTHKYAYKVEKYNSNLNVSKMLENYSVSLNSEIKNILTQEFSNPFQSMKKEIHYQFLYDQFSIKATTKQNDIINLLQEVKKSLITYNMTFLVNNYDQIRSLQSAYRISSIVSDSIQTFPERSNCIVFSTIAITVILTVAIYIALLKAKVTIDIIQGYLAKVSMKQQLKIMKNIDLLLKKYPILIHLDNQNKHKCFDMIQYSKKQLLWQEEGQKKRQIHTESKTIFIIKHYSYILFLIFFIATGVAYQQYVYGETENYVSIVNHMQSMQSSSDFVLTQMTDALNAAVWKQIYNSTKIYGLTNKIKLQTHLESDLPQFYQNYQRFLNQNLYENMCLQQSSFESIAYIAEVGCGEVYDGAVKKGFSMAYQSYRTSLEQIKYSSIEQLLQFKRIKAIYPIFIEAGYTRRLITRLILQFTQKFLSQSAKYCEYLTSNMKKYVLLAVLIYFSLMLLVFYQIYKFRCTCLTQFLMLTTIPRSTLLNIKFSKQMINTHFLTLLERI